MHSLTLPLDYLTDVLVVLFDPGLCAHLYRVPGTTQGRRVAKIERIQVVNTHAMKQGRGKNVDPLGHFPMPMPDHLCPQQATRLAISRETDAQFVRTWVIHFVVPARGLDGERLEACLHCFCIAQSRAGSRHLKHFDHLRAERASEFPAAADGILPSNPPLLMSSRP